MGNFSVKTYPAWNSYNEGVPRALNNFNLTIFDEYTLMDPSRNYILDISDGLTTETYTGTYIDISSVTFYNVNISVQGVTTYSIYEDSPYNIYNSNLNIDPVCYARGTKILCFIDGVEKYINIEDLKENMLVKTYKHGYKKLLILGMGIVKNSYGYICNKMYCYPKENNKDLIEDLYISGPHSVLVDSLTEDEIAKTLTKWKTLLKIEDKYLLMAYANNQCIPVEDNNCYEIYQLVLEHENIKGRYGIWANGILSETMSMHVFMTKKKLINSFMNIE